MAKPIPYMAAVDGWLRANRVIRYSEHHYDTTPDHERLRKYLWRNMYFNLGQIPTDRPKLIAWVRRKKVAGVITPEKCPELFWEN
jgi:hypothetical protein